MLISRLSSLKPASRLVVAMKLVAGLALLVIGVVLALPGIPGPGILIILLGLWLLSHHLLGQESSGVGSRENFWVSPKDGRGTMEMASGVP